MLVLQPSRRVLTNYTAMGTERAGMKENNRVAFKGDGTTLPRQGFYADGFSYDIMRLSILFPQCKSLGEGT